MVKRALIFGVTGQDGSYLSEYLLDKGYEVHGVKRRVSSFHLGRIEHLIGTKNFILHNGDITDTSCIIRLIKTVQPDEIYNLAAQSHVQISFESPEYTANADALGTLRMLEAIRILGLEDKTKFYQASTSELYGKVKEIPQNENTPFCPRSPYAAAKLYAYYVTINYREAYGIFACNGVLFNHESPRRGEDFVTRKITQAIARISKGSKKKLFLGNLDAKRDWGYAKEYVETMYLMLQQSVPDDYVVATGRTCSVRDFVSLAFKVAGIDIQWIGKGLGEKGLDKNGNILVEIDKVFFRPTEVDFLIGDPSKVEKVLGWKAKTSLEELARIMVESDIKALPDLSVPDLSVEDLSVEEKQKDNVVNNIGCGSFTGGKISEL